MQCHPPKPVRDERNVRGRVLLASVSYIFLFCLYVLQNDVYVRISSLCDDMITLQKRMFPDSKIAAAFALKRKKCTALLRQLGNFLGDRLASKLKDNIFSVIIDETTDCSLEKACAVVVRYFDKARNVIQTAMLDILNAYEGQEGGSSREALFKKIIHCLNSYGIPLLGFAADGASNMMGAYNSVTSRLKQDMPGISILKCVSHSIHLCSSEAAKTLPRACENLVRNVYNFFAHSAKRKYEFKEYQVFREAKPHKLLHPCVTRWLSLHNALARIIEQWQSLKLYFNTIMVEERLSSVEKIYESLQDPSFSSYLTFFLLYFATPQQCQCFVSVTTANNSSFA